MDVADGKLPRHIAIIMDGNGRWARRRSLPRSEGHRAGAESIREVAACCLEWRIPYLTVYAFSTENWKRPRAEVRFLMESLARHLPEQRGDLLESDIRFKAIGRIEALPKKVQQEVRETERQTRDCKKLTLSFALNYGGRAEIVDACRAIASKILEGSLKVDEIDEALFARHLQSVGLPELDLLIRTGGDKRVSNFLLWQLYYAEIYVTDVLWPDFRREHFLEALRDFAARKRRFGAVERTPRAARGS